MGCRPDANASKLDGALSVRALGRAVTLRPSLSEGWYELGNIEAGQGKFAQALEAYGRAHRLQPQNPSYCAYLGKALSKLNRRSEALARYREALQINPDFADA